MRFSLFAFCLLAPGLAAQPMSVKYITPAGAEFFEGNSSSDIMLGNWNPSTRVQQVDNNLVGRVLPALRFIGWRRNGQSNAGAAKKADITVIMSHADYNAITSTWATNYKDTPKTVFTKKTVSLPDWNTAAKDIPSPCDFVLPLDSPFIYNRQDALLWDVLNESNPLGTYSQDWVSSTAHTYGDYPSELGGGCTTTNGAMAHRCAMRANTSTFQLGFRVEGAPASAPVLVMIGFADLSLSVPGLCGVVHNDLTFIFPVGVADAQGDVKLTWFPTMPWNAAFPSLVLYTQALAPDPGQTGIPLAVSGGLKNRGPATNAAGPINIKRIYHTSSVTSATGTGPSVSGCPTLYGF